VNARSLADASTLRRRLGSIMEIRPGSDRVTLLLGDRSLRMPARCEPALRLIDEAGTVAADGSVPVGSTADRAVWS
jgi:hypothetical protein